MLFGEYLLENVEGINVSFCDEVNELQLKNEGELESIILLSGQVKLTEWFMNYKGLLE